MRAHREALERWLATTRREGQVFAQENKAPVDEQPEPLQTKQDWLFLVAYLLWLSLFQFLVNDVWIRWEDANIPIGLVGSWIWALMKFAYWCLPIMAYTLFFRKEWLAYFKQIYKPQIKKPATLLLILFWELSILLLNRFKIPSLNYDYIVNGIIATPFIEEFVFRGFILKELSKRLSFRIANLVQGILFSLNHLPWLYALGLFHSPTVLFSRLLFLALFGMVSGYLIKKTKSMLPSVLFHAVNNLFY